MLVLKDIEAGYEQALKGISLSFYDHVIPFEEFWTTERRERTIHRSEQLAFKGGGHNKFLASIFTWWMVQAPRCWWSEYDTYKVATTANSSSTMHTLKSREATENDFEIGTRPAVIKEFNECILDYSDEASPYFHEVTRLKLNLPEGYLQERQLCINYMTLQNILSQREGHRLKQWKLFSEQVLEQVEHPELLKQGVKL
jgi:hypothetical protein